tara:strand:- start:6 stop:650 length:645 start_codon:yes stop_codon:yes gene_type:complete
MKIFFDMDGVLVDFASGAADAIMAYIDVGDDSSRNIRRLINYDGQDKELPITAEYIETITGIKDAKGERTQWMKRVGNAVFSVVGAGGHSYWASLPSLPGFQQMIQHAQDLIGVDNVYVCTAPIKDKDGGCESGKRQWIADNTSIPSNQVYVTEDKPGVLADFPGETCILIDDRTKYCDAWRAGGGLAIRHIPPATMSTVKNTLSQLNLFVNNG